MLSHTRIYGLPRVSYEYTHIWDVSYAYGPIYANWAIQIQNILDHCIAN